MFLKGQGLKSDSPALSKQARSFMLAGWLSHSCSLGDLDFSPSWSWHVRVGVVVLAMCVQFMEVFKGCHTPHQRGPCVANVVVQHPHSSLTNHKLFKLKKHPKNGLYEIHY